MEIRYKINARVLLLGLFGVVMSCTSYLMYVYDPFNMIVRKMGSLGPGTILLKLWEEPPIEILVDVYIFNVTNAKEFLEGKETLKVTQVGPYVYQETLKNTNVSFNENGTLTYYPRRYLKFRRELSVGDPEVDRVQSPNIPLLGIAAALQDSFFKSIGMCTVAASMNAQSFLNISVAEYLWGYEDNLVKVANTFIPSWIDFNRFGILDRLMALDNATNVVTLNINPEKSPASKILKESERHAKYHIHRWNGSPGLHHWGYKDVEGNETDDSNSRCNSVEGSFEGSVFPPDTKENSSYKMYRRAFCRPVAFNYEKKGFSKDGYHGLRFKVDEKFLAAPDENPDNACYCAKGKCLKKGLGSLAPCYYDIPIAISQPHFLNSDPWLLQQVEGMAPNETLHGSNFVIHPMIGIPLEANLRIQINLIMEQTRCSSTQPFNDLTLPLFWLQMRMGNISPFVHKLLFVINNLLPVVSDILIYLLGLGGLALISGSALVALFFTKHPNARLSFSKEYSPIPIIPMNSPYFSPDIRILK